MRTKLTIAAATAALAAGVVAAAGAGATASSTPSAKAPTTASVAATRHVEGRVTAIDRSVRTFTVRDAERGTLRVKVTSATKFERVTFSALRTGTRVDVRAKRVAGAWNATKVERGEVGDNHDAANHDAANHDAANHDAGDDHGGGHGGGNDDGPNHS